MAAGTALSDLETSFGLLKVAARGDIAAQRALAMQSVSLLQTRTDLDPVTLLTDGLIFARMAAVQGDSGDQGRVISMLALLGHELAAQGDGESEEVVAAEAVARVSLLAEQGFDLADAAINKMVEEATPEVAAMAKEYERAMRL